MLLDIVDTQQREEALDLSSCFVVRAPAGSGKTELLARRVLKALSQVSQPDHCLLLTFTQKAVGELQERMSHVFRVPESDLLEETAQLRSLVFKQAREQNWSLSTFWQRIRIKTLDAYFGDLMHTFHPKEERDTKIKISPALQSELIIEEFFKEYLIKAPCPDLVEIAAVYENSFTQLRRLLKELYQSRELWMSDIFSFEEKSLPLEEFFKEQVKYVENLFVEKKDIFESIYHWLCAYKEKIPQVTFENKDWLENLELWKIYSEVFITKSGSWRKKFTSKNGFPAQKDLLQWHTKEDKEQLIEQIDLCQEFFENNQLIKPFFSLLDFWPHNHKIQSFNQLWIKVFKKLIAFSQVYKERENLTDYTDVTMGLWLLKEQEQSWPLVESSLEKSTYHIFVDEAQDLSFIQLEILKKIFSICSFQPQRSFFLVGDPGQAIYHFRGSELGVFEAIEKMNLPGVSFRALALKMNFRSSPTLVKFFNEYSKKFFGEFSWPFLGVDKAAQAYSLKIEKTANNIQAHSDIENPRLEKSTDIKAQYFDSAQSEARSIILEIKKYLQINPQATCALLGRDRKTLKPFIREAEKSQLSVNTTGLYYFLDKEIFFDIFALTRVLLQPEKKEYWMPALRGIFFGANPNDIDIFFREHDESFFEEISLSVQTSAIFSQGYEKISKHYHEFKGYFQRENIDKWLRSFFSTMDIQQFLRAIDFCYFEEFLSHFEDFQHPGQCDFFLLEKQLREVSLRYDEKCSLSILTIHQAKGLEFDRVYLPNLGARLPNQKSQLLYSLKSEGNLLWSLYPTPQIEDRNTESVYLFCQKVYAYHQRYEAQRLLYVALTRAKKQLFLSTSLAPHAENFHKQLATLIEFKPPLGENPSFALNDSEKNSKNKLLSQENNLCYRNVYPREKKFSTLHWKKMPFNEDELDDLTQRAHQRLPRILGLSWHTILSQTKTWPLDSCLLEKEFLENLFFSFGASKQDFQALFAKFAQIYQSLMKGTSIQEIFRKDIEKHVYEYAFYIQEKGRLKKKIVDVFQKDKDGNCRVIEIKSAQIEELDLFLLRKYKNQLEGYRNGLSLLHQRPVQAYFWFLKNDSFLNLEQVNDYLREKEKSI